MSSSLDKLVSNLQNDPFIYTSEEIKNDRKLKLMKQKGVYPYDYMDSFNRFSEKKLPNKDDFTAYYTMNIYLIRNMYMPFKYGIHLN